MTKIAIIGDCHGKINEFAQIVKNCEYGLQLGDLGFKKIHDWFLEHLDCNKFKCSFGNHDYYPYLSREHSMGDWGLWKGIVTIRGAFSIDQKYRIPHISWWPEEQISYTSWEQLFTFYESQKPKIVVSHDCPLIIYKMMGIHDEQYTPLGLQKCFEIWQPDLWIFGHHHRHIEYKFERTTFICLDELEVYQCQI